MRGTCSAEVLSIDRMVTLFNFANPVARSNPSVDHRHQQNPESFSTFVLQIALCQVFLVGIP